MNLVSPGSLLLSTRLVFFISPFTFTISGKLRQAARCVHCVEAALARLFISEERLLFPCSHSNSVTRSSAMSQESPVLWLPIAVLFSFFWGHHQHPSSLPKALRTPALPLTLEIGTCPRILLGHHPTFQAPRSDFHSSRQSIA